MANSPKGFLGYTALIGNSAPSKWEQLKQALWETNLNAPVRGAYDLMNTPYDVLMGGQSPELDQAVGNSFDAAGGVTVGSGMVPAESNALRMGIKGYRAGSPKGRGDLTFYATDPRGAEPYSHGGEFPIQEVELNPSNVFDAKHGEGYKLYKQFLEETGHPAGRGRTGLPFWTVADDLSAWLKAKGYNFDAIKFDENTGVPSIAVSESASKWLKSGGI